MSARSTTENDKNVFKNAISIVYIGRNMCHTQSFQ